MLGGGPAARRAPLEFVEKLLTTNLTSTDTTERNVGMLLDPRPARRMAGRAGYWSWLLVALVVVAVAHRRLGPSSSATTSTVDRALPSSAVQLRCWSRPMTTTRLPFDSDVAACSGFAARRAPSAAHGRPSNEEGPPS